MSQKVQNGEFRRRSGLSAVLVGLALFSAVAVGSEHLPEDEATGAELDRDHNVILISIDTLRSDHLGLSGYPRDTSPNVDTFAKEAVVFSNAIAQAPSTFSSHLSMFTALLPSHHGAMTTERGGATDELETLAEILEANGYRTAAFTDGGKMSGEGGMNQGFQVYEIYKMEEGNLRGRVKLAEKWLREHREEKFFLFLHTYETHPPYNPDRYYLDMFNARLYPLLKTDRTPEMLPNTIALYDASIRSMDDSFGDFIGFLKDNGIYDDAIIVLTSDHGEEFGEHGKIAFHNHALWEPIIRVPLIVKLPGSEGAGAVVSDQVSVVDIMPTILQALGIPCADDLDGRSLIDACLCRSSGESYAISERGSAHRSIRTNRWKHHFIDGETFLFDLAEDSMERRNIAHQQRALEAKLIGHLDEQLGRREIITCAVEVQYSEEITEQLEKLGYLEVAQ